MVVGEDIVCVLEGGACAWVERSEELGVGGGFVVVSEDDVVADGVDEFDAVGGVGAVADDVSEADDAVCVVAGDVGDDGVERFEVGVDVGDECQAWHRFLFSCSRVLVDFSRGLPVCGSGFRGPWSIGSG